MFLDKIRLPTIPLEEKISDDIWTLELHYSFGSIHTLVFSIQTTMSNIRSRRDDWSFVSFIGLSCVWLSRHLRVSETYTVKWDMEPSMVWCSDRRRFSTLPCRRLSISIWPLCTHWLYIWRHLKQFNSVTSPNSSEQDMVTNLSNYWSGWLN